MVMAPVPISLLNIISLAKCVSQQISKMKSMFNVEVPDSLQSLPVAYWTPKMHKSPIGARFIIASNSCSNKILSKNVTAAFKLFYDSLRVYHDKIRYFSGIKTFWIAQNNKPVVDSLTLIRLGFFGGFCGWGGRIPPPS